MRLAAQRWSEVPRDALVLLPVGALEQHGPHLPLDVDTVIATAVADGVAARLPTEMTALVAPAVGYGASGEHQDFAGTVSAGTAALEHTLVEVGRSLSCWARGLVVINGHGGNLDAVVTATRRLRAEGRSASWLPCEHGDIHAGHAETSLLLHLDPTRVRMERAVRGPEGPLERLLPTLRAAGVAAVTPSGVIGDPTSATAEAGARILERLIVRATRLVVEGAPDADGRLRTGAA